MKWIEIRIKTTPEASDAVTEMLTTLGSGGVSIEDPNDIRKEIEKPNSLDYADEDFLKKLGDDVVIKAYFPSSFNIKELTDIILEKIQFISNFLPVGEGYAGYSEVDEEDWSNAWKKYYKPFYITEKTIIKPSWEMFEAKEDEIVIEMDPGMAFGTGTHETTKMCARMIENYVKSGDSVMDVGCGTGILSIVAAKLGAGNVVACDIDPVAVRVAKENCKLNGVDHLVDVSQGVLEDFKREKADMVVANIIANVIIDIAQAMPYYLKNDGLFITSGIIKERKQEVIDEYMKYGFTCEYTAELGEWVAILFKCQNSL